MILAAFHPSPSTPSIGLNNKSIEATAPTGLGGLLSAFNSTKSFWLIDYKASLAYSRSGIESCKI